MTFRFLIDECLSPDLVRLAINSGYTDSTCIRDRGLAGKKDWELMSFIIEEGFTLVTNNNVDFRDKNPPAPGGLYAKQEIHAGLICLNMPHRLLAQQREIFQLVLGELANFPDLYNQAMEVYVGEDGSIEYTTYYLPFPI